MTDQVRSEAKLEAELEAGPADLSNKHTQDQKKALVTSTETKAPTLAF